MKTFAIAWGVLEIVILGFITTALALLVSKPFGHSIRISGIGLLSLHGVRYSNRQRDVSIEISRLHFSFHVPRPMNPRWGTFTADRYEQKDPGCHFSLHKVEAVLWFFPVLFRFSGGPWMDVTLDDFKLRVWTSTNTPNWVQRMRRNLVSAILTGEILRFDSFKSGIAMSSMTSTGVADGQDSSAPPEKPGVIRPDYEDDVRVSGTVDGYQCINWQKRIYSFGHLAVQLRRSWVDERGSFVMIAEKCRWTQVQSEERRQALVEAGFWW